MFAFLKGNLISADPTVAVIENGGVGYEIFISETTFAQISMKVGKDVKLFTYLNVRENEVSLFGFHSAAEKDLFLRLLAVSGVGAKTALQVLSAGDAAALTVSIAAGDVKYLSKIKGIGKKTAERIVLELKGSLADVDVVGEIMLTGRAKVASDVYSDAVSALVSLGFNKTECAQAVKNCTSDKLEDIISEALKKLSR